MNTIQFMPKKSALFWIAIIAILAIVTMTVSQTTSTSSAPRALPILISTTGAATQTDVSDILVSNNTPSGPGGLCPDGKPGC